MAIHRTHNTRNHLGVRNAWEHSPTDQRGAIRRARSRNVETRPARPAVARGVPQRGRIVKAPPPQETMHNIPTAEEIANRRAIEKINADRICIVNQFQGLGDIIFCEPIVRLYHQDGYKIVWPVMPQFCNLNKHFPYITFVNKALVTIDYDWKGFYSTDSTLILPLRVADSIMKVPYHRNMASKYMLWDLPLETWKTTQWQRDKTAEEELFYDILQLSPDEPYNLVSELYTSDCSHRVSVAPNNGKRNVFVEPISNYTLMDWGMVIENAASLYTVGSAINFLIEVLDTKAEEYHMFARMPAEKTCANYDYLFQKPHIVHNEGR